MRVHERRDVEQEDLPVRAPAVQEQQRRARLAAGVEHVDAPAAELERPLQRRPVDVHPGRVVAVGVGRVRARAQDPVAHHSGDLCACRRHVAATVSTACHEHRDRHRLHAAPLLGPALGRRAAPLRHRAARTRTRSPGGSRCCGPSRSARASRRRTREARVLAAEPYPGAVEAVARLARGGPLHPHHLAPRHRRRTTSTERWLTRIELPYDELYCSYDKVARCREIGIDVLIDDSPVNLEASARRRHHRRHAAASLEPRAVRDGGRDLRGRLG